METQTALKTYVIDSSHSQVAFTVRHLGFSKVRGRFTGFEGTVRMDPADPASLEAEGTAEASSITTGELKRDEHLRSGDFFAADEHPALSFKSTGASASGDKLTLTGDLTIRGTTRPVELDVTFLGEATDPWGGSRVAFEAKGTINRTDFGLNWNQVLEAGGLLVSEGVEIELEVQAVQQ